MNLTAAADRIKYIYIQGKKTNAQVLTVIYVFSRWNMEHIIKWNIRQEDVILLFDKIFDNYQLSSQLKLNDVLQSLDSRIKCNLLIE